MPWVKEDDQEALNLKVRPLSDGAYRLKHHATQYAARHLTDGLVYLKDMEEWTLGIKAAKRTGPLISELVARGLWHEMGTRCPSPKCPAYEDEVIDGAWAVHDYFEYNPHKLDVLKKRAFAVEAGRRSASKRAPVDDPLNGTLSEPLNETLDGVFGGAFGNNLNPPRAFSRPVPVPSVLNELTKEERERGEALAEAVTGFMRRNLDAKERPLIPEWARLKRDGEYVPVDEILARMSTEMEKGDSDGNLPSSLKWCHKAVLSLARATGGRATPRLQRVSGKAHAIDAQVAGLLGLGS